MKKILMRAGVIGTAALPLLAFAQQVNAGYLNSIISTLSSLINSLFPVVFAAAILGFMVGVGMYLFHGGDDTKKDNAKEVMKYGLIVLFVMFGVYGILNIVSNVLGVSFGGSITPPQLPR